MSSITTQQTKLDLELVPKEKRLDIRKCNGRLNPGKIQREPTFQVVWMPLASHSHATDSIFLSLQDVPEMHQPWRTFAALINRSYLKRQLVLTSFVSPEHKSFGSDQEEDEDDEEEVKDELVKIPSNDSDDEDETKITDKAEGDEDKEMDYTTSKLYDDVDITLNEPVDTDKGFVQEEGTDAQ
ncbi:hypothetical protein Tco_0558320 [Tanacetum coccineum]